MPYIIGVLGLSFGLPVISFFIESLIIQKPSAVFFLFGKWFIFYAVGFRLLLAGIRQTTNPAFTAKEIFHFEGNESFPVVRELGFANLCFGLIGILSLFLPEWRIVSAFGSGLYYIITAVSHFIKKPAGFNEKFAMVTSVFIFLLLLVYVIMTFKI